MSLCNAADQFERAEGVKAETMIRSDLFALFLLSNSANGSQKDALGRAMGEKAPAGLHFRSFIPSSELVYHYCQAPKRSSQGDTYRLCIRKIQMLRIFAADSIRNAYMPVFIETVKQLLHLRAF